MAEAPVILDPELAHMAVVAPSAVPSGEWSAFSPAPVSGGGGNVIVLNGISWPTYQRLADEVGDRRAVRLTYDRGRLELMSPLPEHEAYSVQLGQFVRVAAVECKIPFKCLGAMTIRREDLARGMEADNCFYLASWPRIRGRKVLEFTVDPPPDLGLEIDVTKTSLERLPIYAALRIPEVWRFTGRELLGYRLNAEGTYTEVEHSAIFPFLRLADVVPFLLKVFDVDEATLTESFRAWLRGLLP
jgi:Uma2 family endonuclease